jgi:hypothetical protein
VWATKQIRQVGDKLSSCSSSFRTLAGDFWPPITHWRASCLFNESRTLESAFISLATPEVDAVVVRISVGAGSFRGLQQNVRQEKTGRSIRPKTAERRSGKS